MGKYNIPNPKKLKSNIRNIPDIERNIIGLDDTDRNPNINLKYFDSKFQCFSEWDKDELILFSEFISKFKNSNWVSIFKSGGSIGSKTGFGMTYHKDDKMKSKLNISEEIKCFELRINKTIRLHGFRSASSFFLVYLDRNHKLFP